MSGRNRREYSIFRDGFAFRVRVFPTGWSSAVNQGFQETSACKESPR